jgi:predicted heme/steroid binding protein
MVYCPFICSNCIYRQQKEFTLQELANYTGINGIPAYVAVEGIVYNVSSNSMWLGGKHYGLSAGKDLTEQFKTCHDKKSILDSLPKVGILKP